MTNKITAIALVVSDLQKAIDFYQNKLGLSVGKTDDGYAELKTEGVVLELMEKRTLPDKLQNRFKNGYPSSAYFAWETVKDVDALYNDLKERGVKFTVKPKTMSWGQRVAYFTDPDGNLWEISQWVK